MEKHVDRSVQEEINAAPWYHEFEFPGGWKTPRVKDLELHRPIWDFIKKGLATIDFQGKTVLDLGCWDGYWSFHAERRGAKEVLASDDCSQNWAASKGLLLAKRLLDSRVETQLDLSV